MSVQALMERERFNSRDSVCLRGRCLNVLFTKTFRFRCQIQLLQFVLFSDPTLSVDAVQTSVVHLDSCRRVISLVFQMYVHVICTEIDGRTRCIMIYLSKNPGIPFVVVRALFVDVKVKK